ncbi:MAG: hypothetical protein A2W08_14845 [Candidatus Rokubacteria bacterium RBG_16_73_20]|nr:MAG: hypothetical protein A2W08_14845 [Candidatus Rokubacteria bacterium RBG_16_73_20]
MLKALVCALLLGAAVLAAPAEHPAAAADEYVVHKFKCPNITTVKLNWANKINANPDFPVSKSYENLTHSAGFKASSVNVAENTVGCLYVIPQTVFQAPYVYKVQRKILSCTGQPGPEITCNLKKN